MHNLLGIDIENYVIHSTQSNSFFKTTQKLSSCVIDTCLNDKYRFNNREIV